MAQRKPSPAGIANTLLDLVSQIPASSHKASNTPVKDSAQVIKSASLRAASVSAALAIPPGPLGMVTILPDLILIWRIQAQMVSDIAAIHGKTGFLTREALLFCLFKHGASQLFRDIVVRVGERYVLRKTSLRMVQRLCERLGLRVTQRMLGASISRWIPVAGAVAVGWYTRYDTKQVGQSALDLFSKDIDTDDLKDVTESERNLP
ncbi:hypothetical protein [Bdellovibrio bacteriovorus]|uniref:Uncharacterized protein n=1 Tax=Bdellovibrio bacteriovorus str. Tiberius TaxID=1069642 RepID=K7YQT7_BDEBC|nr:hypothetical protein [Bdellovibrio bacteriovorus]AFY02246.1 hypothetical protein Bdt_2563 [Bdellovibrio bacteriovorus str. Tiberius]